jgi:hypothetical protein
LAGALGAALVGFALSACSSADDEQTTSRPAGVAANGSLTPTSDDTPGSAAGIGGSYEASHGDSDCTQDCSGHEAGYKWAEENDISDEDDCTGNSESFIEGCKAYVADNG